jgi:hypothetical protein
MSDEEAEGSDGPPQVLFAFVVSPFVYQGGGVQENASCGLQVEF